MIFLSMPISDVDAMKLLCVVVARPSAGPSHGDTQVLQAANVASCGPPAGVLSPLASLLAGDRPRVLCAPSLYFIQTFFRFKL
jgi:hypothetical protein